MKIVQSLWSGPAKQRGGFERYTGAWPHARYFWCSWILSAGWACRHYPRVELVTDDEGARWLVDRMKLPFSNVRTDLQSLTVSGQLWAFGKIIAYHIQQEPFFHIDGDVYLMGRLPERYEQADIVCQFFEQLYGPARFRSVYYRSRVELEGMFKHLPSCWKYMNEESAANCGIFGGQNLDAIHRYTAEVINLVTHPDHQAAWQQKMHVMDYNCVLEQQMLWCSARQQGVTLTPLFEEADYKNEEALRQKALELHYNHAAGEGKNRDVAQHLEGLVQREFPEQYQAIDRLFPLKQ